MADDTSNAAVKAVVRMDRSGGDQQMRPDTLQNRKGGATMKHDTQAITRLLSLTAAAALTLTPSALADTADSALVQNGTLNLREEASLEARILGKYPTGTLVEIIHRGDEWHQVEVNGKGGYMMSRYLNTGENSREATVHTNTGIGLNVREEPDMNGAIITSVKNGSKVTVTQKGSNWSRVLVNGQEGFMSSQYLQFGTSAPALPMGRTAVVNNPRSTQVLNLRKTPSLEAKVLSYYRNGVKVTILEEGKTWHKVQVEDGRIGYMMAKYLKADGGTSIVLPYQARTFNVNGGSYVNFRSGASLNSGILARVPVGTAVTVLEHGTDWCRVQIGTQEGYMSTWFLK